MARPNESPEVLTLVCLTCGAEQFFDSAPASSVKCPTCGSSVFRPFSTPTQPDDVLESQLEDTARSASLGDISPDTAPDDVRELNA